MVVFRQVELEIIVFYEVLAAQEDMCTKWNCECFSCACLNPYRNLAQVRAARVVTGKRPQFQRLKTLLPLQLCVG
jgi:hypothetical protein